MGQKKEDNDVKARGRHQMTMNANGVLKIIVAVFAVMIVLLLGILLIAQPAKGPTVFGAPAVSSDGHLRVDSPRENDLVNSPVSVSGAVTGGGWYFEASFPVKILDGDGTNLGQGPAQAQGEPGAWMTTGTVPFAGSISFATPKYATGTIVFAKDNPSGLPQNDLELRLPVRFK